jgi:hypothetical protein
MLVSGGVLHEGHGPVHNPEKIFGPPLKSLQQQGNLLSKPHFQASENHTGCRDETATDAFWLGKCGLMETGLALHRVTR